MAFGSFAPGGIQQAYSFPFWEAAAFAVTLGRQQLPDYRVSMVNVRALSTNTGTVYIGGSTVTSGNGWELAAGEQTGWIPIQNLNLIYYVGTAVGSLRIMYVR